MDRAFLETNAICRFQEEGITGEEIRAILSCYNYEPVIGLHVIYELARTFLAKGKEDLAASYFNILSDMKPEISEAPEEVIFSEISSSIRGTKVLKFISSSRRQETYDEISELSNGVFDDEAMNFINTRDKEFKAEHKQLGTKNVSLFTENPPSEKLRTFEDVYSYYRNDIPILIHQIAQGKVSEEHCNKLFHQLDKYPSLRSTVLANIYLVFIAVVHKNTAATDKVDDHRHIIEASYCSAFITNENQLLSNLKKINNRIKGIKWSSIGKIHIIGNA